MTVLINDHPEWSLYFLSFISHYCHWSFLPNCLLHPKLQQQSLCGDPADWRPDSYITLMASPRSSTHVWCNVFSTRWNSTALYSKRHKDAVFTLSWCLWQDSHDAEEQRRQNHNGQSCTSSSFGHQINGRPIPSNTHSPVYI